MLYGNLVFVLVVLLIVFGKTVVETGEISRFRILAPEIVCPKDENSVIDKPDNTIVTLNTAIPDLEFKWSVRWAPLDAPTQRFTLMVWKTVRALEDQLNGPQAEPFIYVINNTELLRGVDYLFNVTAIEPAANTNSTSKSFHIDNIKGDPKLIVEGHSDKFSVYLAGGEQTYTDLEYVLEAEVTTCSPNQEYYFTWNVISEQGSAINVSDIFGWRLTIPPYTLLADTTYYVTCRIHKGTGEIVTQTDLPFRVLTRGLKVNLNLDTLLITVGQPFSVEAYVDNRDYYEHSANFKWSCMYRNETCKNFESPNWGTLRFPSGLSDIGKYFVTVEISVLEQYASANATIDTVEPILPAIQVEAVSRLVNEGSVIKLVGNASNVAPSCSLTWYFASEEYLNEFKDNDTCDDCKNGEALSDTITVTSLEENFLDELTDFTNDTEWRQVAVEFQAEAGRARFYAQCGCSLTFNCETMGVVYADITFYINKGPIVGDFKISPETGTAMETIFRVSKPVASDPDKPLRYTLLCSLGDSQPLMLGSNLEHLAIDTFLPYTDSNGTSIWIEVCDSLGACSTSDIRTVSLAPGNGRTVQVLVEDVRGYIRRCETMLLTRIVQSTVVTYTKAGQSEPLSFFIKSLLDALPPAEVNHCLQRTEDYSILLHWLASYGVDTTNMIQ